MAVLNIHTAPQHFSAAANPIRVVLESTDASVKTVHFRLFNTGVVPSAELAAWAQTPDHGTTDAFTFQIDELLEDALSYELPDVASGGVWANDKNCLPYAFIATALDANRDAVGNSLVSDNYYVLNASITDEQQPDLTPYLAEENDRLFLTAAPQEKSIRYGESEYLNFLSGVQQPYKLVIDRHQWNGSVGSLPIDLSQLGAEPSVQVGIGSANLNDLVPNFINDDTRYYEVSLLAPFGQNLFTDGDHGTFELNDTGISSGGFTVDRSTFTSYEGQYSLRASLQNTGINWADVWQGTSAIAFQPNTTYVFQARVFYSEWKSTSGIGAVRINVTGLTDATVSTHAMTVDVNQAPGGFIELNTEVITGADVAGQLVMQQQGDLDGFYLFADAVNIREIGAAANKRTYVLHRDCTTDSTRVHFLNRLGAFDSFTFMGTEKHRLSVSGDSYKRRKPDTWNSRNRGQEAISKVGVQRIVCSSGALKPDEINWLEELLTSPAIYIERAGQYIPVVSRNGDFETLDRAQNIQQLRIELELANNIRSQRN